MSDQTRVVRIRRKNGQVVQDCDVYIGRACKLGGWNLEESKWSNPFHIKEHGREKSLALFREYIIRRPDLLSQIEELRGKILGCWCKPNACHGDILIELLKK